MRHYLFPVLLSSAFLCATVAAENIPQTIEECFTELDRRLSTEQRRDFAGQDEHTAVVKSHHGLATWIRNEWLRNGISSLVGKLKDIGAGSFDDMSSIILRSYWRHLNDVPIELEQQGAEYKKFWKERKTQE